MSPLSRNMTIWGNHSATQYPDFYNAKINGKNADKVISDEAWLKETFIPAVQQRGAAIIKARGSSSAASAANAVVDTVRTLTTDTKSDDWHSVAVCSDGSYGVEKDLISSFPIRTQGGKWEIVQDVPINDFSRSKIDASVAELKEEKVACRRSASAGLTPADSARRFARSGERLAKKRVQHGTVQGAHKTKGPARLVDQVFEKTGIVIGVQQRSARHAILKFLDQPVAKRREEEIATGPNQITTQTQQACGIVGRKMSEQRIAHRQIVGSVPKREQLARHWRGLSVVFCIVDVPMEEVKSVVAAFYMLLQPINDLSIDFDTGIRPEIQSAINQGLSESNPAADIQQIKPGKVRTPNSLGQPLEERLPRVFHAMSHDVGRIALQRRGN